MYKVTTNYNETHERKNVDITSNPGIEPGTSACQITMVTIVTKEVKF